MPCGQPRLVANAPRRPTWPRLTFNGHTLNIRIPHFFGNDRELQNWCSWNCQGPLSLGAYSHTEAPVPRWPGPVVPVPPWRPCHLARSHRPEVPGQTTWTPTGSRRWPQGPHKVALQERTAQAPTETTGHRPVGGHKGTRPAGAEQDQP